MKTTSSEIKIRIPLCSGTAAKSTKLEELEALLDNVSEIANTNIQINFQTLQVIINTLSSDINRMQVSVPDINKKLHYFNDLPTDFTNLQYVVHIVKTDLGYIL